MSDRTDLQRLREYVPKSGLFIMDSGRRINLANLAYYRGLNAMDLAPMGRQFSVGFDDVEVAAGGNRAIALTAGTDSVAVANADIDVDGGSWKITPIVNPDDVGASNEQALTPANHDARSERQPESSVVRCQSSPSGGSVFPAVRRYSQDTPSRAIGGGVVGDGMVIIQPGGVFLFRIQNMGSEPSQLTARLTFIEGVID